MTIIRSYVLFGNISSFAAWGKKTKEKSVTAPILVFFCL